MTTRKDKHFRLTVGLTAEFRKTATLLGFSETKAAKFALAEWVKRNRDEAQKRLDMYAEKGITIVEPQTVNVAVFQKAEMYSARQELWMSNAPSQGMEDHSLAGRTHTEDRQDPREPQGRL